jgi:hypothetical protein
LLLAVQLGIESLARKLLDHLDGLELVLMFAREQKLQVLVVRRADRSNAAAIGVLLLVVFADNVAVLDQSVNLVVKQIGDDLVLLFNIRLDVQVAELVLHHVRDYGVLTVAVRIGGVGTTARLRSSRIPRGSDGSCAGKIEFDRRLVALGHLLEVGRALGAYVTVVVGRVQNLVGLVVDENKFLLRLRVRTPLR